TAARHGHFHIVTWLVDKFDFQVDDVVSSITFGSACMGGNLPLVQFLFNRFIVKLEPLKSFSEVATGLFGCAKTGQLQVMKFLVHELILTNAADIILLDDHLLLMKAIDNGHVSIVKFLIEEFNLNIHPNLLLPKAIISRQPDMVKFFID